MLDFKLAPSDPDFPFELTALECSLTVPATYPSSQPVLRVSNRDMGRGYQINVEHGFDAIVERNPNSTLLQWINTLDRELEGLLSAPKAETVKIISNASSNQKGKTRGDTGMVPLEHVSYGQEQTGATNSNKVSAPTHTTQQLEDAKKKRDVDTHQLEARMGRLPLYAKATDGKSYNIPIEPRKRQYLPLSLQAVKSIKLLVPELYNLEPCTLEYRN